MKSLVVIFVLAAAVSASAQQSQPLTNGWAVGNEWAGPVTIAGREIRTTVIEEGSKRRSGARVDELSWKINPYFEAAMRTWVRGALNGENPARDVLGFEGGKATLYKASRIVEFTLPALRRATYWDDDTCDD